MHQTNQLLSFSFVQDMVSKGMAKTTSLKDAIEVSWLDVCKSIIAIDPKSRDPSQLKNKISQHYKEMTNKVADWHSVGRVIHRVPGGFFAYLAGWMKERNLVQPPIPITWLRDGMLSGVIVLV
jgi:hypothetical protein